MIRKVISALAGLGALALSGCVTSGSKMDLTPFDQRPAKPLFEVGDYCNVEDEPTKNTVNSAEECGHFTWDASTRRYTVTIVEDGKASTLPVSVVSLKNGVLLAQIDSIDFLKLDEDYATKSADAKRKREEDVPPYIHAAVLVVGRAMINIGWQGTAEQLDALAAKHPKITIEGKGTSRTVAAGARDDVLEYIWDFTLLSLNAETPSGASISVRDKLGAPNHKASAAQQRDIKAALKKLDGLKH